MPVDADTLAWEIIQSARSRENVCVLYATPKLVPTPARVLDRIERKIKAALPREVRGFYSGTERLFLVWQEDVGKETTAQPEDWAALSSTDSDFWNEALRPQRDLSKRGGMICIPSAAEVFRKGYGIDRIVPEPSDEEIEMDGETYTDQEVYEALYPFDFIGSYYIAALWHNRKHNEWRVALAEDHGASWTDYNTTTVAEYFEQLATGLGGLRTFASTRGGDKKEIWALHKED